MLARKRFEIGWSDLLRGMIGCWCPIDRSDARSTLERHWSSLGEGFACLSVRSALDLYLCARAFPAGSEILLTGANIPDMSRVVIHHDLIPIPIDFDLRTMAPNIDAIESRRTDHSRALIFAQLFGGIVALDPIGAYCASHGLELVEDCAQAFLGPEYRGHESALLSLFSFGPIKSATALAGALATVRDPELHARMRAIESTWPVAENAEFFARLVKYTGLSLLTQDVPYSILSTTARLTGNDLDRWVGQAARSFPPGQLLEHLRRQPCGPLLSLLHARQRHATAEMYRRRATCGRALVHAIDGAAEVPGVELDRHTFWVFPVLTDTPDALIRELRTAGFDATQRATLAPLGPNLPQLESAFSRLVYLPFDRNLPPRAIERMGEITRGHRSGKTVKPATAANR